MKFSSTGNGYALFLTSDSAVFRLGSPRADSARASLSSSIVRMKLAGASPNATVSGAGTLPGKINYFIGNDPKKWTAGASTYARGGASERGGDQQRSAQRSSHGHLSDQRVGPDVVGNRPRSDYPSPVRGPAARHVSSRHDDAIRHRRRDQRYGPGRCAPLRRALSDQYPASGVALPRRSSHQSFKEAFNRPTEF